MKTVVSCTLVTLLLLVFLAPVTAQAPVEARVLVWESTPQKDGYLYTLSSDGTEEKLMEFPLGVYGNVAMRCGQDSWTDDGKGVVLFTGAAEGDIAIYPIEGGTPVSLGRANRMACAGPMTFQLSSDGKRAGYINYKNESLNRDYPYGDLVIFDTASGAQQTVFDWSNAFALYDDGALMLRFYPDGEGNATEADVDWWDGAGRRTLITLTPVYPADKPDMKCTLTNSSLARIKDTAYIFAGQRCADGAASWWLVGVPMDGGSATTIASGAPGGGFFPESFTAELIPTKDNAGFLATIPSGLARNTVKLQWITLDGAVTPILDNYHVIVDRFGEKLSEARHMQVALDGSAVAFVTSTGDQEQTLWTLDLSTPGGEPLAVEEQGRNQRIFQYSWADNNNLYYIGGSIESNSLQRIVPGEGPQRLSRGRFFRLAVSYDGNKVAASEWFANPESLGDDLFKLTVLDTKGAAFTVKEGGSEHNQMVPLAIN